MLPNPLRILLADDDHDMITEYGEMLKESLAHAEITIVNTPQEVHSIISQKQFELIILDLSFSRGQVEGLELLPKIHAAQPGAIILVQSNHIGPDTAARCVRMGADDFISKLHPSEITSRIHIALSRRAEQLSYERKGKELAKKVGAVYASQAMEKVYALAAEANKTPSLHTLILGATGVGKELVARAIAHPPSKAFITVNCGQLTDSILESTLFGHEKNAFTGATSRQKGKFEAANNGTIFLDEIGNLSERGQEALLRTLEDQTITPVGLNHPRHVKFRLICATHDNLNQLVADGSFREDLYERVAQRVIHIPPLHHRPEDIPSIINHLIKCSSKPELQLDAYLIDVLEKYSWPRNVRQLKNTVTYLIEHAKSATVTFADLPADFYKELSGKLPSPSPKLQNTIPINLRQDDSVQVACKKAISALIDNATQTLGPKSSIRKVAEKIGMSKSALERFSKENNIVWNPKLRSKPNSTLSPYGDAYDAD